ncbi:hypothetical protein C499_12920 [Halogeometricum borinquense DSM 11551]|uniref:Uncharacterized protein n=1 Tax=Halogeometricum borinquense (strain ATCC 700274 / DSM 11551 / JCM 10706 / KCTC 4070 / PR3) TaxID=469382 RepID=E4NUC7_HALBP|nr:hypothetical protein [Halogeometricum borinquense]ADQ68647.1 hypothetical protein Hbor_31120 [Halogeometricum borinquense DSM 11551]ELY25389.1 hypothetical protein C499_12920 [Halogeometricum borinquense DSM 11551]
MSHPLHTGVIGLQVLYTQGLIHFTYKRFVEDNWKNANDTSTDLIEEFNRGTESPQWDGSMKETCKMELNKYSEDIYNTTLENGTDDRDAWDDIVENGSYPCMWYAGACTRGELTHCWPIYPFGQTESGQRNNSLSCYLRKHIRMTFER